MDIEPNQPTTEPVVPTAAETLTGTVQTVAGSYASMGTNPIVRGLSAVLGVALFVVVGGLGILAATVVLNTATAVMMPLTGVGIAFAAVILSVGSLIKTQTIAVDLADAAGQKTSFGSVVGKSVRLIGKMLLLLLMTPQTWIPRYNLAFFAMVDLEVGPKAALTESARLTEGKHYGRDYVALGGAEMAANMIANMGAARDNSGAPLIEDAVSISKAKKYLQYKASTQS